MTRGTTPSLRVALRIIAGRGAARGCIQVSMLVLLPVWGAAEFGAYAAAVGTFLWLWLLVTGAEKAELTVLSRVERLAPQYTRMLLARAAAPVGAAVVIAVGLAPIGGLPALYGAAAAYAAGQGLFQVLASTHRLGGRPGRDSGAFLLLAAWVVAMTALAVAGVLRPYGYLLALLAGVLVGSVILALLVPAVRRRPDRVRRSRWLAALVTRRVLLLGLSDVADSGSVAVLYIVLATVGRPADSALVYLVLLISGVLGSLGVLLLRLMQPATSLRLRGAAGATGRRTARRISGWTAAVTGATATLAFLGALVTGALAGPEALAAIGSHPVALGVAIGIEILGFSATLYAVYQLENTNGAVLSTTSSAAVTGLAASAATALVAIPILHALGAVLALVVGLCAKTAFLYLRQRHDGRFTRPARIAAGAPGWPAPAR